MNRVAGRPSPEGPSLLLGDGNHPVRFLQAPTSPVARELSRDRNRRRLTSRKPGKCSERFLQVGPPRGSGEKGGTPQLVSRPGRDTHLSLRVLTVFLGLLPGLIRAPGPPVPVLSGPLGGEPDLPPGQTLLSYFLVLVFRFVIIVI